MSLQYEIDSKLYYISSQVDCLISFLKEHKKFIQSHLNDFIVKDLHEISCGIRESDFSEKCKQVGNFQCCFDAIYGHCHKYCRRKNDYEIKLKSTQNSSHKTESKNKNTFLSVKKDHEIDAMTSSICEMSKYTLCKNIVDIGSGKGYLGCRLTEVANLNILGIEGSLSCSDSAENRRKQMQKLHVKNDFENCVKTVTYEIDGVTLENSQCFVDMVKDSISEEDNGIKQVDSTMLGVEATVLGTDIAILGVNSAILVGLHSCGDLTSHTLKLFTKESYFKGLQIVGCCYNLCTENPRDVNSQFPMSEYVKTKNIHLGKNARMLACQSPEKWERTNQELHISLLYRSILQKIVADKNLPEDVLGNIKFRGIGKKSKTFGDYLSRIYKYVRPDDVKVISSDAEEYYENYADQWRYMQKYHWLRMQLAPCIERLIILDRLCYLVECGFHNSTIVKLFSPAVSPRCYALLCEKVGEP